MVTGLTSVESLKNFWPAVVHEFAPEVLDAQIGIAILRAQYLINRLGVIDTSADDAAAILEMAANLVTRRLIYSDQHPASTAEPAGVRTETGHGAYYSMFVKRTVEDLIGIEAMSLLTSSGLISITDQQVLMQTEQVFPSAELEVLDTQGNTVRVYNSSLDDQFVDPTYDYARYKRGTS